MISSPSPNRLYQPVLGSPEGIDACTKVYHNRALVHKAMGSFTPCVADCTESLQLDPTFIKAKFTRVACLEHMEVCCPST